MIGDDWLMSAFLSSCCSPSQALLLRLSDGKTEQFDASNVGRREQCSILRVEPETRHSTLASIVSKGINGAFLWLKAGRLTGGWLLVARAAANTRTLFQVEDLDDTVGLTEYEGVLGGGEGHCCDFLFREQFARGELTLLPQVILCHVAWLRIEA